MTDDIETFATIRDTAQTLENMIRIASAGYHDDVYMRVLGDQDTVQFLAQTNARQVMSYCTFSDLKHVEGSAEAIIPVGLDNDTKGYLDYLSIAQGDGTIEMTLQGVEGDGDHPRFATRWSAEGALETSIRLPGSENDLGKVPWGLTERWVGDDRYLSAAALDTSGDGVVIDVDEDEYENYQPPTVIETSVSAINQRIIDPANFMDDVNYYPIVVDGNDFRVELEGGKGDDSINGPVNADSVEGPDVERSFDEGFEELFGELDGPVRLATAPAGGDGPEPPLTVVQNNRTGQTVRHVLGPFADN